MQPKASLLKQHLRYQRRVYALLASLLFWQLMLTPAVYGISFKKLRHDEYTWLYVLEVNPLDYRMLPVKAVGRPESRETVAALAHRYGAVAAINGGFWTQNGSPAGILKISGRWLARAVRPRAAIGWSAARRDPRIDRVLTLPAAGGKGAAKAYHVLPQSQPALSTAEEWARFEHIVGGGPHLIAQGRLVSDYTSERLVRSFVDGKYARTSIGIRADGTWIFLVADSSFFGMLGGLTIAELADVMLALGCEDALNLDGGSSATLVLHGNVVNEPTGDVIENGKLVRAVGDAILILPNN